MSADNNDASESYIDVELYRYLVTGDVTGWTSAITSKEAEVLKLRCARDNNTVLHIAASFGHVQLVEDIVKQWPRLMIQGNSQGDLPIHSALKSGKLGSVRALINWLRGDSCIEADQVLECNNNAKRNTALHIALEYDQEQIARHLVDLYPRASYAMNKEYICPLYQAIKKEFVDLVQHMLLKLQPFKQEALGSLTTGQSVIHAAVAAKRTEMLEHMLNYGNTEIINILDDEGWTALSYAACIGNVDKVEIFLEKVPSSAFLCNKDKSFPIHQTVLGGHIKIIDLLNSTRLLLNAKGQNIFHLASLIGDSPQLVAHLLMNLPDVDSLINQKDEEGNTPLHLATLAKHCEVVKILIQCEGTDVGLSNKEGLTANDLVKKLTLVDGDNSVVKRLYMVLERATTRGLKCFPIDNELYRLLFQGKMDEVDQIVSGQMLQLRDLESSEDGSTVLHLAASTDQHQLVLNLFQRGCGVLMEQGNNFGDLPIHSAAKAGNLQSLIALFQWSNNPTDHIRICEKQNVDGNTALHVAVLNNQREIADYLYEQCPQAAYCLNGNNICPLFLVITEWGRSSLVNSMIEGLEGHAGHAQLQDLVGGKSVVHIAILTRNIGILESIINRAPRLLDSVDSRGRSPLSYAAYAGYVEGVKLLQTSFPDLEYKRDKDEDGSFPIHQAAKSGEVKIIRLLHPETCLLNYKLQNVLHVAAEAGRPRVVKYLLNMQEFKRLLNTGDHNGNTPLHLAVIGFHVRTAFRLVQQKHIKSNLTNKELWTAVDLFQMHLVKKGPKVPSALEINLMELVLNQVSGKSSYVRERIADQGGEGKEKNTKQANGELDADKLNTKQANGELNADKLLVILTLVLTVSYAAMLEAPGFLFDEKAGKLRASHAKFFQHFIEYNEYAFSVAAVAALFVFWCMLAPKFAEVGLLVGLFLSFMGVSCMSLAFFTWSDGISLSGSGKQEFIGMTVKYGVLLAEFTLLLLPLFLLKLVLVFTKFWWVPKRFRRAPMWFIGLMLKYCPKEGTDLDLTI